jgi:hypothetical protein
MTWCWFHAFSVVGLSERAWSDVGLVLQGILALLTYVRACDVAAFKLIEDLVVSHGAYGVGFAALGGCLHKCDFGTSPLCVRHRNQKSNLARCSASCVEH